MGKRLKKKSGQMKWILQFKDGIEIQKKRIIHQEINQIKKVYQIQEIFLDQEEEEEEYRFVNSLIPEEPSKLSKRGLKTSLIIVKGFLSRKNL